LAIQLPEFQPFPPAESKADPVWCGIRFGNERRGDGGVNQGISRGSMCRKRLTCPRTRGGL
jgi:hypothetical protein